MSRPNSGAPVDVSSGWAETSLTADPTPGPAFTLRRLVPFGVVVVLSALSPALPHNITPIVRWWVLAWVVIVLTAGACVIAARLPNGHWWHTVTPLLLFPAIQLLRAADGFASSGFTPLLFLPVLWFALYGPLRDVVLGIVGCALVVIWPILLIGAPRYPASSLRGSLLFLIVLASAGLVMSALVRSTRIAAARLSLSEQRFRAAFDDAPMGIALTGISGAQYGYFLRVNRALCALFGRSAEELTSAPIEAFTHPDDVEQTRSWFAHATESEVAHRLEKRYLHASGRVIWASVSFSVVRDDEGQPVHLITQIEDVSARRQADQALLDALDTERAAAEQMRALDAARIADDVQRGTRSAHPADVGRRVHRTTAGGQCRRTQRHATQAGRDGQPRAEPAGQHRRRTRRRPRASRSRSRRSPGSRWIWARSSTERRRR